jgi:hypothetical protein
MKSIGLAISIAIGLALSLPVSASWSVPTTKEECEARHGEWANFGMPGDPGSRPSCRLNAPDTGKVCKSSSECLSRLCSPKSGSPYEAGEKALDICAPYQPVNGCYQRVEKGVLENIPCVM